MKKQGDAKPFIVENNLYVDMDIKLYHSMTDFYSSSDLKNLLFDPISFFKKFNGQEVDEPKYRDALDFGTYIHTLLLEPEKVDEQFILYDKIRRGVSWEGFKNRNRDKIILNKKQVDLGRIIKHYFMGHTLASSLLSGGRAETSLFSQLEGHKIKVRPDYLIETTDRVKVVDIKTTSDSPNPYYIKSACSRNNYDLSAALYTSLISKQFNKPADFYFIFIYKDPVHILCYKASQDFLEHGANKVTKALDILKDMEKGSVYYDNFLYNV